MQKCVNRVVVAVLFALSSAYAFGGVSVSSPGSGASVQNPVRFVATASSSCSKGVAAMGIYDNNKLLTVVNGSRMDTNVYLAAGVHDNTVVQSWDHCGNAAKVKVSLKVTSKTFYNIEEAKGWLGYGELPPIYDICTDCRPLVQWGMKQGITSPRLSGTSTRFDLGGTLPYSDALWVNHLIGDGTTQNMLDGNESISSGIKNFVYDVYFYSDDLGAGHALEFDLGQYVGGRGFLFGTMCRTEANLQWAIWDNPNARWVDTGIKCNALNKQWNHLVWRFQRTADDQLLYKSVTLNGVTTNLNWYNKSIKSNWHGIVVNYQMDGNKVQKDYAVYLDQFHITYY
jgi:hypothetical protein